MKIRYLFYIFFISILFNNNVLFAFARIDIISDSIDMSYYPETVLNNNVNSQTLSAKNVSSLNNQNTNLNRPFNVSVSNDLQSYSIYVSKNDLTFNEDINLILEMPIMNSIDEIWHERSPYTIQDISTLIYENSNPQFEINQFTFYLSAEIPQHIKAGTYSYAINFELFQNNMPIDRKELQVNITVHETLKFDIVFIDSSVKAMDFGFINSSTKRIDKKIQLQISSNLNKPYRIVQKRAEDMKSNISNIDFYEKGIYFELEEKGLNGKRYYDKASPLIPTDDFIFESDNNGSSEIIDIIFSLQNNSLLKAGKYESDITYTIEPINQSLSFPVITLKFDLLLEVEKILEFKVYPENNEASLDFTPRILEELKKDRLLKVEVKSNTGKNYSFYHSLPNTLLNTDGSSLENKNIKWVLCDDKGNVLPNKSFEEVLSTNQLVFESNEKGDSDVFYVRYQINYDKYQMAGLYRADLRFTLSDD